jgi:hypothetical protein
VTDAIIVASTVSATLTASASNAARRIVSMPSSATITVPPANSTDRPAVSRARTVASARAAPPRISCRYRTNTSRA